MESDNNVMSSSSSTSPMILTASAAASSEDLVANGAILEPEIGNSNASISDEYFRFEKRIDSLWPIQVIDPVLHSSKRSSLISGKYYQARDHEQSRLSTAHVRITHDPTEDKVGSLKTSKSKARCKFSDERRKEVQEIRRQGACIRCRMLKKPVRLILIHHCLEMRLFLLSVPTRIHVAPASASKVQDYGNNHVFGHVLRTS